MLRTNCDVAKVITIHLPCQTEGMKFAL
jgi:hypothetical protein